MVVFDGQQNSNLAAIAVHIWGAEGNGPTSLPSHWGNPLYSGSSLSRAQDPVAVNANRNKACPPGKYPGFQCDEYPFASSRQGAAFSANGDWSTVPVTATANSAQGGVLSSFFTEQRILDPVLYLGNDPDQDRFYVYPVTPTGQTAW